MFTSIFDPRLTPLLLPSAVALISASAVWIGFSISRYHRRTDTLDKRNKQLFAIQAELNVAGSWVGPGYPRTEEARRDFEENHPSQTSSTFRIFPFKLDATRSFLSSGELHLVRESTVEAISHFCQSALNFLDSVSEVQRFKTAHPVEELNYTLSELQRVPGASHLYLKVFKTTLLAMYKEIHFTRIGHEGDSGNLYSTYRRAKEAIQAERSGPLPSRPFDSAFFLLSIVATALATLFLFYGLFLVICTLKSDFCALFWG